MGAQKIDKFITLEEASEILGGMPIKTLRDKIAKGLLPTYKPGKRILLTAEEVIQFAKRAKQ